MSADAPEGEVPRRERRSRFRRWFPVAASLMVFVFVVIQFVPYRVDNPPVLRAPDWNSPETERLVRAACYDCHSNETETPFWEEVAPLSWWITNHVREGRDALNFSECTPGRGENDENEAAETVRERSMPPGYYTWFGMHSDADLSDAERERLAAGLAASLSGLKCGDDD